jgi:hypothetical protein
VTSAADRPASNTAPELLPRAAATRTAASTTSVDVGARVPPFSRNGDPNLGEFNDAVILKTFGEVPEGFAGLKDRMIYREGELRLAMIDRG